MLKNDLLLRAARGEQVERPPIWLMRQAGRILPEYRAIRERLSGFKELVTNSELICEVTIQPVERLEVDAAIIFSDILVIPEALGLPYEMIEQRGPRFPRTIQNEADIDKLDTEDIPAKLSYVTDAIQLTKSALHGKVPLIGFAGAPWTILAYMVEGHGSKTFSAAKRFLYTQPEQAHVLLEKITDATIQYLKAQITAGVDIVQVFDSWAGILGPDMYREFGLAYINRICNEVMEVPVIVFAKDAHFILSDLKDVPCAVVGLDWTMDPQMARKAVGESKTLQGNLDPCVLYASRDVIKRETEKMLQSFGRQQYIANLGHGVYPDVPYQNVQYFVELVKNS